MEVCIVTDKTISCKICGEDFTFSSGEQEYFAERNLSEPKKCKSCAKKAREQRDQQRGGQRDFNSFGKNNNNVIDFNKKKNNFQTDKSDKEAA